MGNTELNRDLRSEWTIVERSNNVGMELKIAE